MKHKTRVVAVSVAAVVACGLLAGCDLVTTNPYKDYEQIIAEVDITKADAFKEGGALAQYKELVEVSEISKRDMVASFAANGSSVMNYYGWSYRDTFEAIKDSLVNQQVFVQYSKVYLVSAKDEETNEYVFADEQGNALYTVAGYKAAIEGKTGTEKTIAGLQYFLDDEEIEKAVYDLRKSFNSTLDSLEEKIILEQDEHDHDTSVRTTPTGVDTENEDYYDSDYRIYTGTQTAFGGYEKVNGSTATTRKKAYSNFLNNIRSSGLLAANEDTSRIENLNYYQSQLKTAYENALVNKITEAFEEQGEANITDEWVESVFEKTKKNQLNAFTEDRTATDAALNGMSDSSFVLIAPDAGYGFVINILLPFSTTQSQQLSDTTMDAGDKQGNKFVTRANILKNVKATDQRGTWFTGHDDYSFEGASAYAGTLSNAAERKYTFFENSFSEEKAGEGKQYELLKNYYGSYTYNGSVTALEEGEGNGHYTLKPYKLNIDEFIAEMEGYLGFAGLNLGASTDHSGTYYTQSVNDYYKGENGTGDVDYSKFVYYEGSVAFDGGFDANEMFVAGSEENIAFSVINELSFAYNTDTAGLNTYLGYAVTPDQTNFVKEFEYAAQQVCKRGAGHYIVAPSDYGWHIIYCTFSFTEAGVSPFEYSAADRLATENCFSDIYFEALKANAQSTFANNKRTEIINEYASVSATVYEKRYADLSNLDKR